MDNLTHGLVGYTLYKLSAPSAPVDGRLERRLLWASILASELPDSDMISVIMGNGATLLWHRTYTHSVPGILLFSLAISLTMTRIWPDLPRRRLFGLTLAAGLLHSLFDLLTSYGTKVFLPWLDIPYALDILPIVDPYLLILLALFLWTGYRNRRKAVLWLLVVFMAGYIGWRSELHQTAISQLRSRMPDAVQVVVMPTIGSIYDWRFCAASPGGFTCGYIRTNGELSVDLFIADLSDDPAVRAVGGTKTVAAFSRRFPQFIAYQVNKEQGLWRVTVLDARYAFPGRTMFAAELWLDDRFNIVKEQMRR